MTSLVSVKGLAKSFVSYKSEFHRFARWFGVPCKPATEHSVLRDINFDIKPGEAIGIVGQNGAGKSTLLKMLTGTLQPTEGSIQINGRVAAILELGMGFNANLTGRQNVIHAAGLMGFSREKINEILPEIEAFSEIGDYFDQAVRTYSSGMQMRVAFAVATSVRPDLLIIDEALAVGDAFFQAKCYKRIAQYQDENTAVILVSHDVTAIVKHCKRAIFLNNGNVEKDGDVRTVSNYFLSSLSARQKSVSSEVSLEPPQTIESLTSSTALDVFSHRLGYRKEEHRWGSGDAHIIDFQFSSKGVKYPTEVITGDRVNFSFKVHFNKSFNNIVPGLLIKTVEGIFLYGTNSMDRTKNITSLSVKKDTSHVYSFCLPMNLNSGDYLISFGISSGDIDAALVPLDRRYDSLILKVNNYKAPFSGLLQLEANFSYDIA